MNKTSIFFSHSSKNAKALATLKELFIAKTGGSLQVFLSSDGQSIPFGRNWVHSIEHALNDSALMFVFLTPESVDSSWIYFESGFAYSRGAEVVPVGFMGLDIASVRPPLSLLQGFNIRSEEGLDNLIAVANRCSGHKHLPSFLPEEYEKVCGSTAAQRSDPAAVVRLLVRDVTFQLKDSLLHDAKTSIQLLAEASKDLGYHYSLTLQPYFMLLLHGMRIEVVRVNSEILRLDFAVSTYSIEAAITFLKKALPRIRAEGIAQVPFRLRLNRSAIVDTHEVIARLAEAGATFAGLGRIQLGKIIFSFEHDSAYSNTSLHAAFATDDAKLSDLADLLCVLTDRGIIEEPRVYQSIF